MLFRDWLTAEERSDILQLDQLLPFESSETLRRKRYAQPEKLLVLAVLKDEVVCLQKYSGSAARRSKRLFEETRQWVLMDDPGWPFSFTNVCEILGLDPRYVRRGLLSLIQPTRSKPPSNDSRISRSCGRQKTVRKAA